MKAVVFTLGCKVNECESDSLIAELTARGWEVSDKLVPADLYIVNTCAVTAEAEKKSRQTASRIRKLSSTAKIIFTGCATQKSAKPFIEKDPNFLVTGVFNKNKILDMIEESGVMISPECKAFEELATVKSLRTRAYIKVQDGCNNFCSYCIIPYLRGRSRSRNPESIIEEIQKVNAKEVVINGINLSAYDFEGVDLAGLIQRLKGVKTRIRLGSLEVGVITDRFLTALKELDDFAPHFHLSLQSGANAVLKKMNRHYTAEEYALKVDLIRKYFPDAGITTDIIVGFPTETEQDFSETVELVNRVDFSDIHPFPFSPRSGTVAFKMQDLPPEVKKQRLSVLLEIKEKQKEAFARKMVGKTLEVIFEEQKDGYYLGYSGNYLRLYLEADSLPNEKVKVKVVSPFLGGAKAIIE
jgi:threonylcarbamoyladenosine tRNA methylthiotransferase MtaB